MAAGEQVKLGDVDERQKHYHEYEFRLSCGRDFNGSVKYETLEAARRGKHTLDSEFPSSCSPHSIEQLVDGEWREVES